MSNEFVTTPLPYSITGVAVGPAESDPVSNLKFWWADAEGNMTVELLWGWNGNEIVYHIIPEGTWRCEDGMVMTNDQCVKHATPNHNVQFRLTVEAGGKVTLYDGEVVLFTRTISQVQSAAGINVSLEYGQLSEVAYHEDSLGGEFVMPWWGWLLIGIGAFFLLVLIGYALYSSSKPKPKPAPPAAAAAPPAQQTVLTVQRPPQQIPGSFPPYSPYGAASTYSALPSSPTPSIYAAPPPMYMHAPVYPPQPGIYNPPTGVTL